MSSAVSAWRQAYPRPGARYCTHFGPRTSSRARAGSAISDAKHLQADVQRCRLDLDAHLRNPGLGLTRQKPHADMYKNSFNPSYHLFIHPFINLSIHPFIHPSIHPFIHSPILLISFTITTTLLLHYYYTSTTPVLLHYASIGASP